MEIKKIENRDYVMFPRMQHRGLVFKHVERNAFKAELRHVPGHGDYWLLHQQSKPHLVAHVQLPKSEAEFDRSALPLATKGTQEHPWLVPGPEQMVRIHRGRSVVPLRRRRL